MKYLSRFILFAFLLSIAGISAHAQQTGISGVVTDPAGAVIPGAKVEVKAPGSASYSAVTNAQGTFVVPSLQAENYVITVSAPGFTTTRREILLLVGQLAQVDIKLSVASAATQVVVEGGNDVAIDTTSSQVAGNVTPSEVQDIPTNGRSYVQLAQLVPGIHANSLGESPVSSGTAGNAGDAETGKFQITLDGLQYAQDSVGSSFGQPHVSQDAISQFQIITNRFDATSGRSAGVYVNVQTHTGTNQLHGGAFGYFRNSAFNAGDPFYIRQHLVNPTIPAVPVFSDQQYGGTLGGKIKTDRLWYFLSYEGEHQPNTASISPLVTTTAGALYTHDSTVTRKEYMGRADFQPNANNHIFGRGDGYSSNTSFVAQGNDPSQAYSSAVSASGYVADWNKTVSPNLINDIHAGFHYWQFENLPFFNVGSIVLTLPGGTFGEPYNEPEIFNQKTQQYRDDLFWLKGKHSIRLGGEYLFTGHGGEFPQYLRGGLTSCQTSSTVSGSALVALYNSFFPNGTLDPASWNYSAINNYCNVSESYTQAFGQYNISISRNIIGAWIQDDWKVLSRLTLNLGIRYDDDIGAYNTSYKPTPGLLTPNSNPNANFAPRIGFSYDPKGDGKTSIRGGAGLYFADQVTNPIIDEELYSSTARALQATVSGTNLALPTPFAGQDPSANPDNYVNTPQPVQRGAKTPYSLQASFGVARELGWRTNITADLVHQRVYDDWILMAGNLLVNPANPEQNLLPTAAMSAATYGTRVCGNTSITLDTLDASNLATAAPGGTPAKQVCNQLFGPATRTFVVYPGAGVIADALQVGIKHSTTNGFTGAIAYTWGRTKNSTGGQFSYPNKPFKSGIQQEWANGTDDQRHSLTVNGEYKWKYGLSLSSLYHFGSGLAFGTSSGSTVNGYAGSTRTLASQPIAPGTTCPVAACTTVYAPLKKFYYDSGYGYWIMQRDGFRGTPYHRIDARLQEALPIREKYHVILAVEAFNLLNHPNYGTFATTASVGSGTNAYGSALTSGSIFEFQSRALQFIGRFSF